MWKCQVCNYLASDEQAPQKCPKCGAPQEKFVELASEHKEKIERSRFTNSLLKELILSMEQIEELSQAGIEDNLDPGCVKIFKEALQSANFLKQSSLAEIEIHIGKGKWG